MAERETPWWSSATRTSAIKGQAPLAPELPASGLVRPVIVTLGLARGPRSTVLPDAVCTGRLPPAPIDLPKIAYLGQIRFGHWLSSEMSVLTFP